MNNFPMNYKNQLPQEVRGIAIVLDGDEVSINSLFTALVANNKIIYRWFIATHDKDNEPLHYHIGLIVAGKSSKNLDYILRILYLDTIPNIKNKIRLLHPQTMVGLLYWLNYSLHRTEDSISDGKYQYTTDAITATPDWNWAIDIINQPHNTKKSKNSLRDEIRHRVLYEGMTIKQVMDKYPDEYIADNDKLDKLRNKYLADFAPLPKIRLNYVICGDGGIGKGLLAEAIARALYPDLSDDDDIFHHVGSKGVAFEGYHGQPVLIWDDRRAFDLLVELGGRGNVFNVFEVHPKKQMHQIKYSSVNLINEVNIVNSVEDWTSFLNTLAGDEDKNQSYRRFPLIFPVHECDFDMLVNKGFADNTREFQEYYKYKNIIGNFQKLKVLFRTNDEECREAEMRAVQPIVNQHQALVETQYLPLSPNEEQEKEECFATYGKQDVMKVLENGGDILHGYSDEFPNPKKRDKQDIIEIPFEEIKPDNDFEEVISTDLPF